MGHEKHRQIPGRAYGQEQSPQGEHDVTQDEIKEKKEHEVDQGGGNRLVFYLTECGLRTPDKGRDFPDEVQAHGRGIGIEYQKCFPGISEHRVGNDKK
ncbi:MAG: hypothetical protein ACM3X8_04025 [Methanomicrobiales archaeon]